MELIKRDNFRDLKEIIQNKVYTKILVVCGKNSFRPAGAGAIIKKLVFRKNISYYLKKKKIPEIQELLLLTEKIKKTQPTLIIAIGGGAVMDLAKVANLMALEKNIKKKIQNNIYKNQKKFCDLVAIPMTAGSGAEVTSNAVIYIGKKKYSVEGDLVKPDHMALFPKLVISNKKIHIVNSSAFDCFSQSIESMFSKRSTDESVNFSIKSIEVFLRHYNKYINNKNFENGYQMSLASYYSGKAISISKTIAPHAVSYPFTSYFNVHHGHAVSLTLNEFLKFNYLNIDKSSSKFSLKSRYNLLFKLLKVKNIAELTNKINFLKSSFSLESNLSLIDKRIPRKIDLITKNVNTQRLTNNPTKISREDIHKILKSII